MRIEQLLRDGAERFGAKVAIVSGRRHHSYRDLDAKSAHVAAALAANGVRRGDRVAIFMDNTFEAVVATFAIVRVGAVACPLDQAIGAAALTAALDNAGAVGLFTEARLAAVAATALATTNRVKVVVLSGGDGSPAPTGCLIFEDIARSIAATAEGLPAGEADEPAVVLNFAGVGGALEPQTLTHGDLVAAASVSETPADAVVTADLSLATHYGLYQLLTAIRAGATQVLHGASTFRESVFGPDDRAQADARLALAG